MVKLTYPKLFIQSQQRKPVTLWNWRHCEVRSKKDGVTIRRNNENRWVEGERQRCLYNVYDNRKWRWGTESTEEGNPGLTSRLPWQKRTGERVRTSRGNKSWGSWRHEETSWIVLTIINKLHKSNKLRGTDGTNGDIEIINRDSWIIHESFINNILNYHLLTYLHKYFLVLSDTTVL